MPIMVTYIAHDDWHHVNQLISIFFVFISNVENIPRYITAGLLNVIADVFNSKVFDYPDYISQALKVLYGIIRKLCAYDGSIRQQLNLLGIPPVAELFPI
jgi:hypothetical protein